MTLLIGADPEVFIANKGEIIPVVGHLGGTKKEPLPVMCGALQEDNVLAEFNIDPASTSSMFVSNIKTVMGQLRERIDPFEIVIRASHDFDRGTLMRSGRQAMMFGCDPDYNAYDGSKNIPPSALSTLRTAGGHIHIGYDNPTPERNRQIVKMMDIHLGLASCVLDTDARRREMYGKAGAYRDKPYGVEYRTLSNFWLQHTSWMEWAFEQAVTAFNDDTDYGDEVHRKVMAALGPTVYPSEAHRLITQLGIRLP